MNTIITFRAIATATNFRLWGERFDTSAEMTEAEFDGMDTKSKLALLAEAFGDEPAYLMDPHTGSVDTADNWDTDGYTQQNAELIAVVEDIDGNWIAA